MSRKSESNQKAALWSAFGQFLRENDVTIKNSDDVNSIMKDPYGVEISDSSISRLTDKIMPIIKEWQERPLEEIYAVVYMDAIHFHVRSKGRIIKKAVYIALGIDLEGHKDVLGMYVGENESAKFWLSIMNGLNIGLT